MTNWLIHPLTGTETRASVSEQVGRRMDTAFRQQRCLLLVLPIWWKQKIFQKTQNKHIKTIMIFLFPASLAPLGYPVLQLTPEPLRNSELNGLNNAKHL